MSSKSSYTKYLLLSLSFIFTFSLVNCLGQTGGLTKKLDNTRLLFFQDSVNEVIDLTQGLPENPPKSINEKLIWLDILRFRWMSLANLDRFNQILTEIEGVKNKLSKKRKLIESPQAFLVEWMKIRTYQSMGYLKKGRQLADSLEEEASRWMKKDQPVYAYFCELKGNEAFYQSDYLAADQWYGKSLEVVEIQGPYMDTLEVIHRIFNLAYLHYSLGNTKKSDDYYQKALNIHARNGGGPMMKSILKLVKISNLMSSMRNQEAYRELLVFIDVYKQYPDAKIRQASVMNLLGDCIRYQNPSKAYKHYAEALSILDRTEAYPICIEKRATTLANMGYITGLMQDFQKSDSLFARSIELLQNSPEYDLYLQSIEASILDAWGRAYLYAKKPEKAQKILHEVLEKIWTIYGKDSREAFRVLNNLGLTYQDQKNYKEAQKLFEQILQIEKIDFSQPKPFSKSQNPINSSYILWNNADTYLLMYDEEKDQALAREYLKRAYLGYDRYINFLDEIRSSYRSAGAKLGFASENRIAYERAAWTYTQLASPYLDADSVKEKLWDYSEKSRGMILLEALNQQKATGFNGVAPSVLRRQDTLKMLAQRADLAYFFAKQRADLDSVRRNKIFKEKLKAELTYERFLDSLLDKLPDYYKLKYQFETIALDQVGNLLPDSTAFLSFFYDTQMVYIFTIDQRGSDLLVKPWPKFLPKLDSCIIRFQKSISNPLEQLSYKKREATIKEYQDMGHLLYQELIAPVEDRLPQNVIVIPDGRMSLLPFEALLDDIPAPSEKYSFKTYPYLLHRYNISYVPSASLFQQMKGPTSNAKLPFSGMAPFETDKDLQADTIKREGFVPLEGSGEEVSFAQSIYAGRVFLGKEATKSAFHKYSKWARIIHLSTHGSLDINSNWDFKLMFVGEKAPVQYVPLHMREVYSLNLKHVDLVCLSACDAGVGELNGGEGILSMARAFSYAGANSILTSLWKVENTATSELMQGFYRGLSKGKLKSAALTWAKKDFLKGSQSQSRFFPYYWSSFILIGNTNPIAP